MEHRGEGLSRVHRTKDGHTERPPSPQLHGAVLVKHRQDRHRVGGLFCLEYRGYSEVVYCDRYCFAFLHALIFSIVSLTLV